MSSRKRKRADGLDPPVVSPGTDENAIWPDKGEWKRLKAQKIQLEKQEFYNLDTVRRRARRIAVEAAHRSLTRSNPDWTPAILRFSSTQSSDMDWTSAKGETKLHGNSQNRNKRQRSAPENVQPHAASFPATKKSERKLKETEKEQPVKQPAASLPSREIKGRRKNKMRKDREASLDGEAAHTALQTLSTNTGTGTVRPKQDDGPLRHDRAPKSKRALRRSRSRASREGARTGGTREHER